MAVFRVIHHPIECCKADGGKDLYRTEEIITGILKDIGSPQNSTDYLIGTIGVGHLKAAEQFARTAQIFRKTNGIYLRHMVLSFRPDECMMLGEAMNLGYRIASYYTNRFQMIVVAQMMEKGYQKIHFLMNTVSYVDGREFKDDLKDRFYFQEHAKEMCREEGRYLSVSMDY